VLFKNSLKAMAQKLLFVERVGEKTGTLILG
jgi:hypothetical protein